jgi:alpha-tubulin suppressor-like RCC1 family protein
MASCLFHSLLLTKNGAVYQYKHKKISNCENAQFEKIIFPVDEKITSISCGHHNSLLLTNNYHVYDWYPSNKSHEFKKIELNDIKILKKTCCGMNKSLLLSFDGDIYELKMALMRGLMLEEVTFYLKYYVMKKFIDITMH